MFNVAQLIEKKRDGQALADAEIAFVIGGYAQQKIPDYQMAALAMAICWRGMSTAETVALTRAMLDSGEKLTWPDPRPKVDKHSTGGIGDKVSISLAPLLAACGAAVPMISGRGLGATGGTLDKLESIAGYRTNLSLGEFRNVVNWTGCSINGATPELVPADRRLYALRDVTGTVPSVSLITASILSKKLVEGLDALALDVKWGSGAFVATLAEAQTLAASLVETAATFGLKCTALISDMNQPLGRMIGNGVEVDESVDVLRGEGPPDVVELTIELGARLLALAGIALDIGDGKKRLCRAIADGTGYEKLAEMVREHGGDLAGPRPRGKERVVTADEAGYVAAIDGKRLGLSIIEMGGGRRALGESIDPSVGIEFLARLGQNISRGEPLARVFCDRPTAAETAEHLVAMAVRVSPHPLDPPPLIVQEISPRAIA